jgi:hypothetical protein
MIQILELTKHYANGTAKTENKMFTKNNVTQSMLDAVNSVLNEKKMSEADLDETGLRKAAYAAHSAGQKMFTFKGKTYPVRVQGETVTYGEAVEEETEIDEAASGEVTKTKTGLIHRSTKAYGGSKPEKHVLDTLKGPKTKELIKKDMEDEKKTRGRYDEETEGDFKKKLIEGWKMKKEELKGQQHKIDKNKNDKIDAQDFAILRGEKKMKEDVEIDETVRRSDIPASVRKARGDAPLTPAEVKAPAKDSISASANLAKARNEEVEEIEEVKKPTGQLKDACWKGYTAVGMKMKGGRKVPNCVPEEVEIEEEMIDEKAGYSAKAARAGKDIGKPGKMFGKIAASAAKRYGSKDRGEKVAGAILAKLRKEEEEFTDEEVDAILELYDLEERKMTDAEMAKREKIVKGMKKGLTGFKQRYGARAKDVMYATATKQAMEEIDPKVRTKDTLKGREVSTQKDDVGPGSDAKSTKVKYHGGPMQEAKEQEPPFDKPYTKAKGVVTDKSGAKHTPMSRARDLARTAMKRLKTEMLGKAPGNN